MPIAKLICTSNPVQEIVAFNPAVVAYEVSIITQRILGIFMVGLTTVFLASNSIGSVSIEEAIQKRIAMFKSSGENIKKLNKLIRAGDASKAIRLMDFHVTWSEDMLLLFPLGSEASTSNGSDASSDIWDNPTGFKNVIKQYNLTSKDLRRFLQSADSNSINETFKNFVGTCKSCHKQFRN
jgi:cytochrome c556